MAGIAADNDQVHRRSVCKWIDETHKVFRRVAKYYKGTNVEFRRYRCNDVFTGHSIDQMGEAPKSLLDGGAQFTSYKTESLKDLGRLAHVFTPTMTQGSFTPACRISGQNVNFSAFASTAVEVQKTGVFLFHPEYLA